MKVETYSIEQQPVKKLTEVTISCDRCNKSFKVFESHECTSLTTFCELDYVEVTCQVPNLTSRKLDKINYHFCLECWNEVKDLKNK